MGDIHGCHRKLVGLLVAPCCTSENRVWENPDRQAIFVGVRLTEARSGDIIKVVQAMAKSESAHIVMANNEFSSISFSIRASPRGGSRFGS